VAWKSWNDRISPRGCAFRNRFGLRFQRTLQFHVDELTAPGIGLGQHFQLRSQRSLNLPPLSARRPRADGRDVLVRLQKTVNLRTAASGCFNSPTKLEKWVFASQRLRRASMSSIVSPPTARQTLGSAGEENGAREWKTKPSPFVFNNGADITGEQPQMQLRGLPESPQNFRTQGLTPS